MKRICVFCGSSAGNRPEYREAAVHLGRLLTSRGHALVYGGSRVGLMGALADAAMEAGGEVIGVIPRHLEAKEIAHTGLSRLYVVESMHERKALMEKLSQAFILMPGGFGSWDEFCEIVTWGQLGLHSKPCGILNVQGYYDALLKQTDHAVLEGFVRSAHADSIAVEASPEALLALLIG